MANLRIFGLEFDNIIAMFQISVFEFVLLQSLLQKLKSLNLGPKMPYFGTFGLEFEKKKLLLYLKSAPSNLSDCKFREKTKMSKFETTNV